MIAEYKYYTKFLNEINTTLETYVQDTATNVIQEITPVTHTMMIIYIMFWAMLMWGGGIKEPVTDGARRLIKISIITGLILNIGRYNYYISDFLWSLPEALAKLIVTSGSDNVSQLQFLDDILNQFFEVFLKFEEEATLQENSFGIPNLVLLASGFIVLICGMILTACAAALLIEAKIIIAILISIGPIFILFTMFEATKKFFDAWIGQILTAIFTIMLASAVIKIVLTVTKQFIFDLNAVENLAPGTDQMLGLCVLTIIGLFGFYKTPGYASALGGGIAISTFAPVNWAFDRAQNAPRNAITTAKSLRKANQKIDQADAYIRSKFRKNTIKRN